jgi:hypothetical protein
LEAKRDLNALQTHPLPHPTGLNQTPLNRGGVVVDLLEKACESIGLKAVQIQMLCISTFLVLAAGIEQRSGSGSGSGSRGSAEKSSRSGAVDGLPKLD